MDGFPSSVGSGFLVPRLCVHNLHKHTSKHCFHQNIIFIFIRIYLRSSLFVVILMRNSMNFQTMTFKWTSLSERFFTKIAFIWPDTYTQKVKVSFYSIWNCSKLPVCVRVCLFKSKVSLNPFPQNVQRYRFTSLWHFMCRFRSRWSVKAFWQILHLNFEGSSSHRAGGSFSDSGLTGASRARGFLIPWPPFISSSGASGGIPNWNNNYTNLDKNLKYD